MVSVNFNEYDYLRMFWPDTSICVGASLVTMINMGFPNSLNYSAPEMTPTKSQKIKNYFLVYFLSLFRLLEFFSIVKVNINIYISKYARKKHGLS